MYDSTSGTIQTQKDVEILLSNIIQERNILRAQNDHLWKVIERQKQIIQSLQDSPSPLKEINTSGLRENRKSSARKRTSQKVSDTEKAQLSGLPNVSKTTISSSSLQKVTSPNSSLHLDKKSFEKEALPALEREPTNSKRLSKNSSVDEIESSSTASPDKHDRRSYLAPSRNSTSSNPEDLINTVVSPRQSIARKRGATKVSLPPEEDRPASPRRPHHLADNLSRRGSTTTKSPNIDELLSAATPLADKLEDPAIKSTSEDDIAVLVYPQIRDIKSLKEYKISFIEMIIHQNKQSQEVPFLLFSVSSIKDPSTELYRVEKQYTDLFVVDMKIKAGVSHSILSTLAKFPDKSLFTGMGASNPLKESTRRQIVESFIDNLIAHVPEDSELVSFFTSGVGFPVIPAEVNLNVFIF